MSKKIFLIGFMGCGKSYIGKQLSELLQIDLIETDDLVEKYLGKKIPDIFSMKGEEAFRKAESHVLRQLILDPQNKIIATGGGMPCFDDNMKLMNEHGITVYLYRSIGSLHNILKNDTKIRPMLAGQPDLLKVIVDLFSKREDFYLKAQHTIAVEDFDTAKAAAGNITGLLHL